VNRARTYAGTVEPRRLGSASGRFELSVSNSHADFMAATMGPVVWMRTARKTGYFARRIGREVHSRSGYRETLSLRGKFWFHLMLGYRYGTTSAQIRLKKQRPLALRGRSFRRTIRHFALPLSRRSLCSRNTLLLTGSFASSSRAPMLPVYCKTPMSGGGTACHIYQFRPGGLASSMQSWRMIL